MDVKQKFREEKNMDVYAKDVTDGSFSNIYVKWLEQQLLLHNVSQQRELLLAFLEYVQETNSDNDTIVDNEEFIKGFQSQL